MSSVSARSYASLKDATRLRSLDRIAERTSVRDISILLAAGALAALAIAWLPLPLRVPGHVILKAAAPIVLGIAAAPRPFAGLIAGVGAAGTLGVLIVTGVGHVPTAAATSLLALGPAIDLAVMSLQHSRLSVYLQFALAGLAANFLAFAVRWCTAWLGLDALQSHQFRHFGWIALLSYSVCGVVAGLLCAVVAFRSTPQTSP